MTNTLSGKKLQKITNKVVNFQSKRQRGDYQKIAERSYYSPSHVRNVLTGNRSMNLDIVDDADYIVRNR